MPTFRKPPTAYNKPWHARAKRDDLEWSLGYYATKEEAIAAEQHFNTNVVPRKVNQHG